MPLMYTPTNSTSDPSCASFAREHGGGEETRTDGVVAQHRVDWHVMRGVLRLAWCSLCGVMLSALAMAAAPSPSNPTAAQPLVQRKKLGAVLLTLSTDRQTMGFADRLGLSLGVETPPEMAVIFARVGGSLGPFTVRSQRRIGPEKTMAHTWRWLQEYILEAEHLGV